jgi:hypothetical protein
MAQNDDHLMILLMQRFQTIANQSRTDALNLWQNRSSRCNWHWAF